MGESMGAKRAAGEEKEEERRDKRRKKDNENRMAIVVLAITADNEMVAWVSRGSPSRAKEGRIGEVNFMDTPRIGGGEGITKGIWNRASRIPRLMMEGSNLERESQISQIRKANVLDEHSK